MSRQETREENQSPELRPNDPTLRFNREKIADPHEIQNAKFLIGNWVVSPEWAIYRETKGKWLLGINFMSHPGQDRSILDFRFVLKISKLKKGQPDEWAETAEIVLSGLEAQTADLVKERRTPELVVRSAEEAFDCFVICSLALSDGFSPRHIERVAKELEKAVRQENIATRGSFTRAFSRLLSETRYLPARVHY